MRHLCIALLAALHVGAHAQVADAAPNTTYDGLWDVTLSCPAHHEDDDAKGYVHRFPAEVKNGVLRGTHGTEGEPSWHLLSGTIAKDGQASLALDGIVNNPDYALNNAHRGKPYSYRVRARFEPTQGSGERIGKRKCSFDFRHR